MCGIKNCLKNYKEFTDFITNFDVIGLTETKTDDADDILIPGYVTFVKNQQTLSKTRSGGILVAVKDYVIKFVKIIRTDCKYVFWFTIDKSLR